ncbi:hypothetical protein FB45DRAFT_1022573 [Roridomyces roridus]|uniref:IBR domain-containing protein n=1 Tax=Roridomyces roridus TaxID=1738132 RepID=A0AAD7C8B4_9AGAR|nr:hypothetical protein FB45DRAFT_1022573 [Roridomyces roridus]
MFKKYKAFVKNEGKFQPPGARALQDFVNLYDAQHDAGLVSKVVRAETEAALRRSGDRIRSAEALTSQTSIDSSASLSLRRATSTSSFGTFSQPAGSSKAEMEITYTPRPPQSDSGSSSGAASTHRTSGFTESAPSSLSLLSRSRSYSSVGTEATSVDSPTSPALAMSPKSLMRAVLAPHPEHESEIEEEDVPHSRQSPTALWVSRTPIPPARPPTTQPPDQWGWATKKTQARDKDLQMWAASTSQASQVERERSTPESIQPQTRMASPPPLVLPEPPVSLSHTAVAAYTREGKEFNSVLPPVLPVQLPPAPSASVRAKSVPIPGNLRECMCFVLPELVKARDGKQLQQQQQSPGRYGISLDPCNHVFCGACLAESIYHSLNMAFDLTTYGAKLPVYAPDHLHGFGKPEFPIMCPTCLFKRRQTMRPPTQITDTMARLVLGAPNMDEWNHGRLLQTLNLVHCPRKGCNESFDLDDAIPAGPQHPKQRVHCPRCRQSICKACKSGWHETPVDCVRYNQAQGPRPAPLRDHYPRNNQVVAAKPVVESRIASPDPRRRVMIYNPAETGRHGATTWMWDEHSGSLQHLHQ